MSHELTGLNTHHSQLKTGHRLLLVALVLASGFACGKKGPPRAPIVRVPDRATAVTARRVGDEVVVRFTVPTTNANGQGPADIERVDVYAYTGTASGEETVDIVKEGTLVGSIKVRKPPDEVEEDRRARRSRKENEPPPPPPPMEPKPPGTYDQGEIATVTETLTPAVRAPEKVAVEAREERRRQTGPPRFVALRWPAPLELPRRYYAAVAVSPGGKKGGLSQRAIVPIFVPVSPPPKADARYNEAAVTVFWLPPPDAPRPMLGLPPAAVPLPAAEGAAADTPQPKPTQVVPLLQSRSIVASRLPITYNVYDDKPDETGVIKPLNEQPLSEPTFVDTRPIEFGVERCYYVRTVTPVGGSDNQLMVESAPSEKFCFEPADSFPPAAPRNLAAVGAEGVISLIWEPNAETDLDGYLVLRGEAPGETLWPLTPAPIRETTFRDTTAKPGVRYVYVVQAVDNATPKPNVSAPSNRVEEAAR